MDLQQLNAKKPITIVAEIGSSHGGDLIKAKELICSAKEAGADIAKFQIIFANEIVSPKSGIIPLCGRNRSIYNDFKAVQMDQNFFCELQQECEKKNIEFFATVFGNKSLQTYYQLPSTPKKVKIASPEINHFPLFEQINQLPLLVWLSTGASTMQDIKNALSYLKHCDVLFHCVTQYPTQPKNCNLKAIKTLKKEFGLQIGFSDHTKDVYEAAIVAHYYGATIFEKHFTLSNSNDGLDDSFALTPNNFEKMATTLHQINKLTHEEEKYQIIDIIGKKQFNLLSGSSKKRLTKSEKSIYHTTHRSWVATKAIAKGEIIDKSNAALLRAELNKTGGIFSSPKQLNIFGSTARKNYDEGDGINLIKPLKLSDKDR